jgi:hypothetical protein
MPRKNKIPDFSELGGKRVWSEDTPQSEVDAYEEQLKAQRAENEIMREATEQLGENAPSN